MSWGRCSSKRLAPLVRGTGRAWTIGLRKAGMLGQNVVRRYFVEDNGWPPNAPSTIAQKGSDRPLIDTGELRKSVAYVVVADGRREVGL